MKKTLITLLALAGVATADTSVLNDAYIGFTDFSSGEKAADLGTMKDSITLSTEGDIITLSCGAGAYFDTAANEAGSDGLSITLVVNLAEVPSITTTTKIATAAGIRSEKPDVTLGMALNSDRSLSTWYQSDARDFSSSALGSEGTITLTYTVGSDGSYIYVGDNTTYVTDTALKSSLYDYGTIEINGLGGAVEQVYIHNRTLSSAEVGTLMKEIASIPEPATATLSLLALCGLAARRRRR